LKTYYIGTMATMGVGMGYAIAGTYRLKFLSYSINKFFHYFYFLAKLYYPNKRVVAIVGDSAFGFR
jgi:thiamine pyrophosphate-dependent acetolactate synthase large subunit-like protein